MMVLKGLHAFFPAKSLVPSILVINVIFLNLKNLPYFFFISVNWISAGRPIFVTSSSLSPVPCINHLEFADGSTLGLV